MRRPTEQQTVPRGRLGRGSLLLLAMTCGVAVGNVYFPQALSPLVAADLHVPTAVTGGVVTATQVGYAAGIFLLVPLGDRLPHNRLIIGLLCLTGMSLLAAGLAPGAGPLVAAAACVGTSTVAAPVIAVAAVGMVGDDRRGSVTGTLLSGSIGGILLARTFGGVLGEQLGWRAPYLIAAAFALVLATLLARTLPRGTPSSSRPYLSLLAEPVRLLRSERQLRRSAFYQATIFAGFSAVWTALALLLTGPTYGMGAETVGLVALVSAATMFCTPFIGARVDRRGPDVVNLASMVATVGAAAVLTLGALGGATGMVALVLGTLVLDIAMQSGMIANQVRFFALRPHARGRLNTAYMTCAYLGGSAGSWLGIQAYCELGWLGPCALVTVLAAAALAQHSRSARRGHADCPRP